MRPVKRLIDLSFLLLLLLLLFLVRMMNYEFTNDLCCVCWVRRYLQSAIIANDISDRAILVRVVDFIFAVVFCLTTNKQTNKQTNNQPTNQPNNKQRRYHMPCRDRRCASRLAKTPVSIVSNFRTFRFQSRFCVSGCTGVYPLNLEGRNISLDGWQRDGAFVRSNMMRNVISLD